MSDSSARLSSSLAITEKKTHIQRPGGCVGIFFQLFDWNRRFAKKKFFPKKLLPPVRTKVSKKFNAEEKLPLTKHLLIADESNNNGGFSSKMKKNGGSEIKKHEMQAPGLVARLMGLEAMPLCVAEQDKFNKNSSKEDCKVKGEKFGGGTNNGLAKEELSLSPEKGNVRPQKIQRTGVLDRKPVTRFGAEALQIKNVLSRSRKYHHNHHHPKLASPVKSPKVGRNTSRLIDVAARILEPGIQATNRARSSLTYSNSTMQQPWKDRGMNEVRGDVDLENEILNAQAACRSCGNFLEHLNERYDDEEKSRDVDLPASISREIFFHGIEESRARTAVYLENENDVVLLKTRYPSERVTTQPVDDRSPIKNETARNRMHQTQCHEDIPISRMFTSQKGASPSTAFRNRTQRHGQMLPGDRVPPKSKLTSTQGRRGSSAVNPASVSKDFITLNRNMSRNRPRVPSKLNSSIEADRRLFIGKDDSLAAQRSPVRKRRTPNAIRQADDACSASPLLEKQRSNRVNIVTGNGTRSRSSPANQTCLRSRTANQRGNRNTDIVSFTFSSPVKSNKGTTSDENVEHKMTTEENRVKKPSQDYLQMNGDALGALLEQKLKELSNQVENEAAAGFMPSARTTASILQELISALTVERAVSSENGSHGTGTIDSQCDSEVTDIVSQAKMSTKKSSDGFSREVDHFSPGCVLDASFSNDSCISSSFDDNSVKQVTSTDSDLLDSASSTNKPRGCGVMVVTDLVKHTSAILQNVNRVHSRLTATKLDYVQEIVMNAELLFGNALHSSSRILDFLVGPFLEELESLVIAAWKNSIIIGIEVRKEENPLRKFLLDCLVECLDVKYTRYADSGFRAWSRLPKSINAEVLIKMFDEEVRKWISFAGNTPDMIIEREMSTSLGKWTDFEIEGFETGAVISQDIVQVLVDEIVMDFCGSG